MRGRGRCLFPRRSTDERSHPAAEAAFAQAVLIGLRILSRDTWDEDDSPGEGAHRSNAECVLCSWRVEVDSGDGDVSERICDRCRAVREVPSAVRSTDPPGFYMHPARTCEKRSWDEMPNDSGTFAHLEWERIALRWRLACERGFRWIPNKGTCTDTFFRLGPSGAVL